MPFCIRLRDGYLTDTKVEDMKPLGSRSDWESFQARIRDDRLFVDYSVTF